MEGSSSSHEILPTKKKVFLHVSSPCAFKTLNPALTFLMARYTRLGVHLRMKKNQTLSCTLVYKVLTYLLRDPLFLCSTRYVSLSDLQSLWPHFKSLRDLGMSWVTAAAHINFGQSHLVPLRQQCPGQLLQRANSYFLERSETQS